MFVLVILALIAFSFNLEKKPKAPKISGSSFGKIKVNGKLYEKDIQKLTDEHTGRIDTLSTEKEAELSEV